MCGIVGMVSKYQNGFWKSHAELFTNMVRMDTVRGADSTGVFGVSPAGNVDVVKGDADGYIFTKSIQYDKFEQKIYRSYRMVVGHNRSATRGDVTPQNAHPFVEGNIVLVHNGTIFNSEDLNKEAEVDSHAICHALNQHNAVEALGKINGAYALVWYNKEDKTLNLARNNSRPLVLLETEDLWIISSEVGLPAWLLHRGISPTKPKQIKMVPIDKILSFPMDSLHNDPVEIAYEEYRAPPIVSTWKPTTYSGYPHPDRTTPMFEKPHIRLSGAIGTYKIGDTIRIVFADYKEDQVVPSTTLFVGNPVFNNEVDNGVVVHYAVFSENMHEASEKIIENEFFIGKITGSTIFNNVPILYVTDVVPISLHKTFNDETFSSVELCDIISTGCPRCNKPIKMEDISETIIKRKQDGTHRVVCKTCVDESLRQAGNAGSTELVCVH